MASSNQEFSKSDVELLLRNPAYVALERRIALAVGLPLLYDDLELVMPLVIRELNDFQLSRAQVFQLLSNPTERSAAFGVALLQGERAVPDEQEWDPAEGNQQELTSKGELIGLSPGFALLPLVYLHFLDDREDLELLLVLRRRRTPRAKKLLSRLRRYQKQLSAV